MPRRLVGSRHRRLLPPVEMRSEYQRAAQLRGDCRRAKRVAAAIAAEDAITLEEMLAGDPDELAEIMTLLPVAK